MFYLSVCSGIEAATVAWEPLGFHAVAYAEIEKFPAAVLAHHYPAVPNLGDMTQIKGEEYRGIVDILVGGTPCQAFSVAGARRGLEDARGNLTLVFARLADEIQPGFIVWENVPGVLSSKDNAFGCFLGLLAGEDDALVAPGGRWTDAGYVLGPKRAIAWRILDAQYFGLAQRRRRVFLVACPRNGADPREILFEREGMRRDSAPSRDAGQGVAPTISARTKGGGGLGTDFDCDGGLTVIKGAAIGRAPASGPQYGEILRDGTTYTLNCTEVHAVLAFAQNQLGEVRTGEVFNTVNQNQNASGRNTPMVCFGGNNPNPIDVATARNAHAGPHGRLDFESETFCVHATQDPITSDVVPLLEVGARTGKSTTDPRAGIGIGGSQDPMFTLQSGKQHGVGVAFQVRRLTPVECERLQGFPDGYTAIPWRNKPADQCPDGPRYKSLGNSFAVPVVRWIGKRITECEAKNGR